MTNEQNNKELNLLLKVGFAEGISFLLLLFIAMPLKYFADMPLPVRVAGMIHGVLFLWFVVALIKAKLEYNWTNKKMLIGFVLSLFPFGTFYLERTLR